ncbi:hypothetical protein EVG20_g2545 [Dentipellis fragilis]|uniref:Xylanolytic transcriptional activator regulatory domain-containing protein n=1 Tax=Dentipellis fragilis TaxID=205917 RepID=A0A4Y9Z9J6_9AGAM|nr:hypothetical protein EVG20_g2545 [Dentipellis fragilis]
MCCRLGLAKRRVLISLKSNADGQEEHLFLVQSVVDLSFGVIERFPVRRAQKEDVLQSVQMVTQRSFDLISLPILTCCSGTMASGKINNRYVLANTEELHVKITGLTTRILELEEALQALQNTLAPDVQHPLLKPELLLSKSLSPPCTSGSSAEDGCDNEDDIVDTFGTMSIGPTGDTRFFGATARSEFLIGVRHTIGHAFRCQIPHASAADPSIPGKTFYDVTRLDARLFNVAFPDTENDKIDGDLRRLVWSYLPPLDEACNLCTLYLSRNNLTFGSVTRAQLFDEVIATVYNPCADAVGCAHALSLLFIVCAMGAISDLDRTDYEIEAHEYFILSRAAMALECPIHTTTVIAVQTLCFMAQYLDLSGSKLLPSASGKAWLYLGIAVKLAHSMGLHLNGSRWNLDESERRKRARVFWHLVMVDTWFSFGSGRPPSVNLDFVSCEMPADSSEYITADGKKEISVHRWHHLYAQLVYKIMVGVYSAKTPRYLDVLEFDRQVVEFPTPEHLCLTLANESDPESTPYLTCQRWMIRSYKEWTLLNLHRAYFAVALRDKPADLVKHKYGSSVMAVCRAAYRMVEAAEIALQYVDGLFFRSNFACSRVLSAAIVMCLLVCNAPSSNLAMASLQVLDRACLLLERSGGRGCQLASQSLEFTQSLQRQAREAMSNTEQYAESPRTAGELERLGGMTQLISQGPTYHTTNAPLYADHEGQNDVHTMTPEVNLPEVAYWQGMQPDGNAPVAQHNSYGPSQHNPYDPSQHNLYDPPQQPYASTSQAQASQPTHFMAEPAQNARYAGFVYDESFTEPSIFTTQPPPAAIDVQSPAPYILDATWQDFMEQLGF